jgi:hypothetical protein
VVCISGHYPINQSKPCLIFTHLIHVAIRTWIIVHPDKKFVLVVVRNFVWICLEVLLPNTNTGSKHVCANILQVAEAKDNFHITSESLWVCQSLVDTCHVQTSQLSGLLLVTKDPSTTLQTDWLRHQGRRVWIPWSGDTSYVGVSSVTDKSAPRPSLLSSFTFHYWPIYENVALWDHRHVAVVTSVNDIRTKCNPVNVAVEQAVFLY